MVDKFSFGREVNSTDEDAWEAIANRPRLVLSANEGIRGIVSEIRV